MTSHVTRLSWTDPEGVEWRAEVKNGPVRLIRREPDPSSAAVDETSFEIPQEAFVRICTAMAGVLKVVHA